MWFIRDLTEVLIIITFYDTIVIACYKHMFVDNCHCVYRLPKIQLDREKYVSTIETLITHGYIIHTRGLLRTT